MKVGRYRYQEFEVPSLVECTRVTTLVDILYFI